MLLNNVILMHLRLKVLGVSTQGHAVCEAGLRTRKQSWSYHITKCEI